MQTATAGYSKLNSYVFKLPQGIIKVKVISLISGNQATGYGHSWTKALENAINHYKKQYGHSRKLAILID
ncbi:hypothetical protein BMS3Abin04_01529 [bacterium BMS3Abin04]|nr:hypothetical protein BMS3Abin04_01529 [bacterium BMS3Abin04]